MSYPSNSTSTRPGIYATAAELVRIRQRLAAHDWYARCFANLRAPADQLLRRGISIPHEKGFVFYETCPADNTPLVQDPFDARNHPCPTCGRNYVEEPYYRAWVTYYQMYVSHRATEMGVAYHLTGDDAYATAIRDVLVTYARRYTDYPLADNVLGPTRLFQSTYIESLWLAGLVAAADLVRDRISRADWQLITEDLFLASAEVIRDYDEGDNNRQAMNNVALGFVGLVCEDTALVDHAVRGAHGWLHHLETSVLEDGMWYEGDNYHFATLPAMLDLAEAMTRHGEDLWNAEAGGHHLKMMFDAPLVNLYPDGTLPARKDSRYASPIGQRWHAGMYELAYARYRDPAYAGLLRTLYADPPAVDDCIPNIAGLIDVLPSEPAHRERLDLRGFLNAVPDLEGPLGLPTRRSADLPGTGLAVLRSDEGRTYASVDYGRYGGGHGHPDRLQLNLYSRGRRWLTDWGTGNYRFDHLRWYRATVAHNTVVVDGRSQQPTDGRLHRFVDEDGIGFVDASADRVYPNLRYRRQTLMLGPDLLLDVFAVASDEPRRYDWAIHPHAEPEADLSVPMAPSSIEGEAYDWLQAVRHGAVDGDWTARFQQGADTLVVHGVGEPGTELFTGGAYGPPQRIPEALPVLLVRREAERATFVTLFEHRTDGAAIVERFKTTTPGEYEVALTDGRRYVCHLDDEAVTSVHGYAADGVLEHATPLGDDDPDAGKETGELDVDAWLPNLAPPTLRVQLVARRPEVRTVTLSSSGTSRDLAVTDAHPVDVELDAPLDELRLELEVRDGHGPVRRRIDVPVAHLGREYRLDRAEQVCRGETAWGGPDQLSARFRAEREADRLVLSISVTDATFAVSRNVEAPHDQDGVQVYLDPRGDRHRHDPTLSGVVGLLLLPGAPDGPPAELLPIRGARPEDPAELQDVALRSQVRDDGYDLELHLPLAHLGTIPAPGDKIGFDLLVNDNVGTFRRRQQLVWSGANGRIWLRKDQHRPQRFGALVL